MYNDGCWNLPADIANLFIRDTELVESTFASIFENKLYQCCQL